MSTDLIVCENVTLGYEGNAVVENLNFSLIEGDHLYILGENGSGKSTLIKSMLGLNPVMSGEIKWCGGLKPTQIGYLPQQTSIQKDFPALVEEIVLSGCLNRIRFRPFYGSKERSVAKSNMERLGITDLSKRCYRELSGGQQQRVLLARALCATSKVLLLDEPVTGLDPMATADLYSLIEELNKSGITVVMISHDIEAAVKYAKHILHISENIFFGTTEEYVKSGQGKMYLNVREEKELDR